MIHFDPALDASGAASAATADARAAIEGQMAMLTRLAQVGMEIAEACGREARAAAADPAAPVRARDIGPAFARVARAVRMTIALQSRLMKDLAALDKADYLEAMRRQDERRIRIRRLATDAARASVDARRRSGAQFWADEDAIEDEIDRLSDETYERLTDAEDCDLDRLSFDEAAAAICRDLGLSADWTARVRAVVEAPDACSRDAVRPITRPPPTTGSGPNSPPPAPLPRGERKGPAP